MFFRGVGENGGARGGGDTSVGEKLLSTLLTEIDGLELAQVLHLCNESTVSSIEGHLFHLY